MDDSRAKFILRFDECCKNFPEQQSELIFLLSTTMLNILERLERLESLSYHDELREWFDKQVPWSRKTFGEGKRTLGVIDHIRKELKEIEAAPQDIYEWIDVITLAFDGASRAGFSYDDILTGLKKKQIINFNRKWPVPSDDETKAVEHLK